jgi:hypothetical protein
MRRAFRLAMKQPSAPSFLTAPSVERTLAPMGFPLPRKAYQALGALAAAFYLCLSLVTAFPGLHHHGPEESTHSADTLGSDCLSCALQAQSKDAPSAPLGDVQLENGPEGRFLSFDFLLPALLPVGSKPARGPPGSLLA